MLRDKANSSGVSTGLIRDQYSVIRRMWGTSYNDTVQALTALQAIG